MEGWRMILLVNGGLCYFMAFSAWAIAQIGSENADGLATPMERVSWGLVIGGTLLLLLGATLRRKKGPLPP